MKKKRPSGGGLSLKQIWIMIFEYYVENIQDDGFLDYLDYRENLPDVFNTELDLFPNICNHKVTGKKINLYDVFQKIKYNLVDDITPDILLTDKYFGKERNPKYDQKKKQLPLVAFNATFNGSKEVKNIREITNLMYLDIDTFTNKKEAEDYKKDITNKYPWIIACYRSLSKIGLHIIIQVDRIHNNDDYNAKYDFISNQYFGGILDKGAKSLSRFTTIPFDLDIYINESSKVLEIDKEYQGYKKSLSSHNKFGGVIIKTPYTFLQGDNANLNIAGRDRGLKFKFPVDENLFTDRNQPLHSPEGEEVVEFTLYPHLNYPVKEGDRTYFIGAKTMDLLWLNGQTSTKEDILRFMTWVNKRCCDPPLPYEEVVNSVEYNWNKYHRGEMDFSKRKTKKHSFWSPKCSLSANEKRKITCSLNHSVQMKKNMEKIYNAIEDLFSDGVKITQKKVSERTGIGLSTLKQKRYWQEFKGMVKEMNSNLRDSGTHPVEDENISITNEQITAIFRQVFKPFLKRLDEPQLKMIYEEFSSRLFDLPKEDFELMITPIEQIESSNAFFRRSTLESNFWGLVSDMA